MNSEVETATVEDPLIETVIEEFEEDEGSHKYETGVIELVNLSEHILAVSCSVSRAHNISIRISLEIVEFYSKVFPQLCRTIKAYFRTKIGPEAAINDYLLDWYYKSSVYQAPCLFIY